MCEEGPVTLSLSLFRIKWLDTFRKQVCFASTDCFVTCSAKATCACVLIILLRPMLYWVAYFLFNHIILDLPLRRWHSLIFWVSIRGLWWVSINIGLCWLSCYMARLSITRLSYLPSILFSRCSPHCVIFHVGLRIQMVQGCNVLSVTFVFTILWNQTLWPECIPHQCWTNRIPGIISTPTRHALLNVHHPSPTM